MAPLDRSVTIGDPIVDAVLGDLVASLEARFPGRIRAYYLIGSFADGTAVATSDLDLKIIFQERLDPATEAQPAQQVVAACAQRSPIGVDVVFIGEDDVLTVGDLDIKLGSRLLAGEDIRERMPLWPIELLARVLMHELIRFIARARGTPGPLIVPLNYPDPAGEFYGYDRRRLRSRDGGEHATTKDLVRIVTGAASALVAWRARQYVVKKNECVAIYQAAIADEWGELIAAIDRTCRVELGYLLPADPDGRQQVRHLCARALEFENHFLALYRDFALEEMRRTAGDTAWLPIILATSMLGQDAPTVHEYIGRGALQSIVQQGRPVVAAGPCYRGWAARMLGQVIYPNDGEVIATLTALAGSPDESVRSVAQRSLQTIQSVASTA
jgi:hypothetical protein